MPTKTLADVKDVLDKADELTDDTTSDVDIQGQLEEAHRRLEASTGRFFEERRILRELNSDDEIPRKQRLSLRPVYEVIEVLHYDTRVDDADYTVLSEDGAIDFTEGFRDENLDTLDRLTFRYVPTVYRDLEVWIAVEQLLSEDLIALPDDQISTLRREATRQIMRKKKYVSRTRGPSIVSDGAAGLRRGTK